MTAVAEHASTARANVAPWPFPRVRPAQVEEIEPLMFMCRKLHDENGIGPRMDEGMVRDEVYKIFDSMKVDRDENDDAGKDRRLGIIGVIGDEGRIEGSVCLIATRLWYANYWWLEDRWCFVLPEYRKSDNSKQLIQFAKWLASDMGLPLMMSLISNKRTEAKIRLFERELGPKAGAFFLCGTETGKH